MINLDQVQTSEAALKRAEAADVDLEELKLQAPEQYMMFCAETFLEVSQELLEFASSVFYASFRNHQLFQVTGDDIQLKAFPALTKQEIDKFGNALGQLVDHPKFAFPLAYVRTVSDASGQRHQFVLPLSPENYQGELNKLVGPFIDEEEAKNWAARQEKEGVSHDVLRHAGSWFCDLFKL